MTILVILSMTFIFSTYEPVTQSGVLALPSAATCGKYFIKHPSHSGTCQGDLLKMTSRSQPECAVLCALTSQCAAYTYSRQGMTCQLDTGQGSSCEMQLHCPKWHFGKSFCELSEQNHRWTFYDCDSDTDTDICGDASAGGLITLDGTHGKTAPVDLCRAVSLYEIPGENYNVTVEFSNKQSMWGVDAGHPGILFNIVDDTNFDAVYLRIHSVENCYQVGYYENGKWNRGNQGPCPAGQPKGVTWHKFALRISGDDVTALVDDVEAVKSTARFRSRGHVGVFLWNNYDNIVEFRNFSIS